MRQRSGVSSELGGVANRAEHALKSSAIVRWCCAAHPEGDGVDPALEAEDANPRGPVRVVLRPSQPIESEGQA